ncbi:MAG: hypothetical protein ABIQ15_04155 [Nocardioides sp.]
MRTALGLGLVAILLTGCQGEETADVRTTRKALAWLTADHLGEPSRATTDHDAAEEFDRDGIGTELGYGQQVVLAVGNDLPEALYDCDGADTERMDGCEKTEYGVLMWQDLEPEEDPGVVYVVVPKGDSAVLMFGSGPDITGDPRDLDLPVSVAEMFEIANDPRVDVTTTQEAVDGGRAIDFWARG